AWASRGRETGREHGGRHSRDAILDQRPQDRDQKRKANQRRHAGQGQRRYVRDLASKAPAHTEDKARLSSLRSMKRAAAMTVNVIRNSSAPSATSDEVYMSPTASVNSFAMDAEIVVPGANSEVLTL